MDGYTSRHASKLYEITPQTVSVWSKEFAQYLSPTANPGERKKRIFTAEDMSVFSLISDMQKQGASFPEIHASLKTGSRGDPPEISPDDVHSVIFSDTETRLALEVERMQSALLDARQALQKADQDLKRLRNVEDENIRLKTELDQTKSQLEATRTELREQINELMERVERLSKESGREYTKGFIDGMNQNKSEE